VGRKSMSKVNGKSLGALRQKLRKYIRENLEEEVAKFRENPDAEDEEEEEEVEKEESEEEEKEVGFYNFFSINCFKLSFFCSFDIRFYFLFC